MAWHHNKLGLFSVRSAYYCQWNYKFGRHNRNDDISEVQTIQFGGNCGTLRFLAKLRSLGGGFFML
jgi:hypothetical protein